MRTVANSSSHEVRVHTLKAVDDTVAEPSPFAFALLPRPQIDRLLNDVLRHAVTVLEAPAGYGKTAVLWQWCRAASQRGLTSVYVNLKDSVRTSESLLEQLNRALESAGIATDGATWHGVGTTTLLLIDDYPMTNSAEMDEAFGALMRSVPGELHVAVATRAPVRWSLSRMLLKGHAQRIESSQLRFAQQETAAYFVDFSPSAADLEALERSVCGWPAALHVLRMSHEKSQNLGVSALLKSPPDLAVRYVVEQVLDAVPDEVLDLLIIAAAVQHASAALLDAVRGEDDSRTLLQKAADSGVPMLFDANSGELRCVHPFVEACLTREVNRLGETRRRELHLRALTWHLEHNNVDASVHHATLAGDPRKVFEVIDALDGVLLQLRSGGAALEHVFQQLPQTWLTEFPRAGVARAMLLTKSGRLQEGRMILQSIRAAATNGSAAAMRVLDRLSVVEYFLSLIDNRDLTDRDEEELRRQLEAQAGFDPCAKQLLGVALSNARLRRGDLAGATDSALEAEFWSKQADIPYGTFFVNQRLCILHLHRGRIRAAREYFERAATIAASLQSTEPQMMLLADTLGAVVLLEQNDAAAHPLLQRSLPRIHQVKGLSDSHIFAYTVAARAEYARHGLAPALQVLTRAAEFGDRRGISRLSHAMNFQRADLMLLSGKPREALAQLASTGMQINGDVVEYPAGLPPIDSIYGALSLARVLRGNGDIERALQLCSQVVANCESTDAQRLLLRCRLQQALMYQQLGRTDESMAALHLALRVAAPENALRCFIDEGEPLAELLRIAVRTTGINQLSADVVSFVAAIIGHQKEEKTEAKAVGALLSPREYDVLVQLAVGHSNKLIARKLDLTENTVKFHLRSLYDKLGVGCRVLAVAVAREKGILTE